jgi:ABC-2 type transport system ATP-binding protein
MIIDVCNVSKKYRYFEKSVGVVGSIKDLFQRKYLYRDALKEINFNVTKPDIIGLIGPNGAGKTTMLKLLSGIISPTEGKITVLGYDPYKRKNEFKKMLGFVMGNKTQSFWDLPASESFMASKVIYNIKPDVYSKRVKYLTELLNIDKKINVPVRNLSFGERMKVELVMCLLHEPQLVFLDEPTIGLDFGTQESLRKYIKEYFEIKKNTTFIITSHNMQDIEILCDRIIIIKEGVLVYDGSKKKMRDNKKKIKLVLGMEANDDERKKLGEFGYIEKDSYTYEKEMDFKAFKNDYTGVLENIPINDISFGEEDFQKIVAYYLEKNNDKNI